MNQVFDVVGRTAKTGAGVMLLAALSALPGLAAGATVPQCSSHAVQFTANYLAETKPGQGPGFLFEIDNKTTHPITLVAPVPSSAHWYANVGNLWLWRASAGRGGALVNAENVHGPVFVFRPRLDPKVDPKNDPQRDPQNGFKTITVPAHGKHVWTEWMRADSAIAYQPSCAHCNYPGERNFRAVFGYAWLPPFGQHVDHLLTCGLRSNPVDMPPLDLSAKKTSAGR